MEFLSTLLGVTELNVTYVAIGLLVICLIAALVYIVVTPMIDTFDNL